MTDTEIQEFEGVKIGDKFPANNAWIYKVVRFAPRAKKYPIVARAICRGTEKRFSAHYVKTMKLP